MITEEQINEIYERTDTNWNDNWLVDFAKELIKAHEDSKWVKFDSEDETTYPPVGITDLIVATECCGTFGETVIFTGCEFYDGYSKEVRNVTHWQRLPKSPKG